MKVCEVLMGPILGNDGVAHNEGEEIILEDRTAELFERFGFVRIIGDAPDGSEVAGRAAPEESVTEPTPTEPVTESPTTEGDAVQEPVTTTTTRKSRSTTTTTATEPVEVAT